ncbi:MAG: hypothetical protein P1V81_10030 [Planctomycetota bacterium]|nr:hypothetical protein [Planctomycetota bacterium]
MRASLALLALAALELAAGSAAGQDLSLLVDVNTTATPLSGVSPYHEPVQHGGLAFLSAWTPDKGNELWVSDGTAVGTHMLVDLNPGANGSHPSEFFSDGTWLYFSALTASTGRELYRTDGTAAGTQLVADVNPGPADSNPMDLVRLGGSILFFADRDDVGHELFSTDGSAAGTQLVADLTTNLVLASSSHLTVLPTGGKALFRAYDGSTGYELYVTDGTTAGTGLLMDLVPGTGGGMIGNFVPFGSKLVFEATTTAAGHELWITDGTLAGTTLMVDLNPGSSGSFPELEQAVVLGSHIYFPASDGSTGLELWLSDGTSAGTRQVVDLVPGIGPSDPEELTLLGGTVYFCAGWGTSQNRQLIATSGVGKVRLVKEIYPGLSSKVSWMTELAGKLYFRATGGPGFTKYENPWVSDGTTAGTQLLMDLNPGSYGGAGGFTQTPNGVLFHGKTPTYGHELLITDGTPAGTAVMFDVAVGSTTGTSGPEELTSVGGRRLYFSADDGVHGREPWVWDPVNGAKLVADVFDDPSYSHPDSDPYGFTGAWLKGKWRVVFAADSDDEGCEPWVTDGTPAGTKLIKNIRNFWSDSNPAEFTPFAGKVYFSAEDNDDRELWVTDGTSGGTVQLANIATATNADSNPHELIVLGKQLLFAATGDSGETELWVTDGTANGTVRLVDIHAGVSSNPRHLTRVGDRIAFLVDRATGGGSELWVTDGTAAGTTLVSDVDPGDQGPMDQLVTQDGVLFFRAEAGGSESLWRSDLTPGGTVELLSFLPWEKILHLTPAAGKLFFAQGGELFVTDPLGSSATQLTTVTTGATPQPFDLVATGRGVYFAVDPSGTYLTDEELWFSDGTQAGTQVVADVFPGDNTSFFSPSPNKSKPSDLVLVDGALMFSAYNGYTVGREVFRLDDIGAYAQDLGRGSSGGSGQWIEATPPALGQTITVRGWNAPSGSILALDLMPQAPTSAFTVGQDVAWMSPLTAIPLSLTTAPSWTWSLPLPLDLALVGTAFSLQSWTPVAGTLPAETSNGVMLVPGL